MYLLSLIGKFEKKETACGQGSTMKRTEDTREFLHRVLREYNIKSMIDIGCGDWNWMKTVNLYGIDYTGYDFDWDFIKENQLDYPQHKFVHWNVLEHNEYPKVDLILCRDFLIHFENNHIITLLNQFDRSGSKYLMTTSYPDAGFEDFTEKQKKQKYTRNKRPSRAVDMSVLMKDPIDYVVEKKNMNRILGLWEL